MRLRVVSAAEPCRTTPPTPIVIIVGCCFRYDAITAAALHTFDALTSHPRYSVTLITSHNELNERDIEVVRDATDLLLHPRFLAAELIIYHFGIYHPLFDVMVVGNGKARQAAFFHNVTPAQFMPPSEAETVARSFSQLNCLRFMDRLWPVSQTNLETLKELDFDAARADVIPLAVSTPAEGWLGAKVAAPIEVLFLGRIVRSKGVIDLCNAIAALPRASMPPFRVRIAGSLSHSHADCVAMVKLLVSERGLSDYVHFLGTIGDNERDRLLGSSHILAIPSYHEGFCKPVIEGMRAGCVPVGYGTYNLRFIADGLCRMVAVGDIGALSDALARLICSLHLAYHNSQHRLMLDRGAYSLEEFDEAAHIHVSQFNPNRIADLTRHHVEAALCGPKAPVVRYPRLSSALVAL